MVIRVFIASSSCSVAIKKRQQDIVRFLEANKIEFEEVDITMSEEQRRWMYKHIPQDKQPAQGNPLPPQIFRDDQYCGNITEDSIFVHEIVPGRCCYCGFSHEIAQEDTVFHDNSVFLVRFHTRRRCLPRCSGKRIMTRFLKPRKATLSLHFLG